MAVCQLSKGLNLRDLKASVSTYMGSVNYLKKVIPLSIANIVYHRVDYDDQYFETRKVKDLSYKSFSKKVQPEHALAFIYHSTQNAMDSLEKKLLKELYVIINDKESNKILESYNFLFSYTADEQVVIKKGDHIVKATADFFHGIELLSEFPKLPDTVTYDLQVVLNDDAPKDYDTPGFERGDPIIVPVPIIEDTQFLKLAKIKTGFHKVDVIAKGDIINVSPQTTTHRNASDVAMEDLQDNVDAPEVADGLEGIKFNPEENIYRQDTILEPKLVITEISDCRDDAMEVDETVFNAPRTIDDPSAQTVNHNTSFTITDAGSSPDFGGIHRIDLKMNCICKIKKHFDFTDLITCNLCAFQSHVACIGFRSVQSMKKPFHCMYCCLRNRTKYVDCRMKTAVTETRQRILATVRLLTLFYLENPSKGPEVFLQSVPDQKKMTDHLTRFKLIYLHKDKLKFRKDVLDICVTKHFYREIDSMTLTSSAISVVEVENDSEKL